MVKTMTGVQVVRLKSYFVWQFKHMFSVFKQYYTYFYTFLFTYIFKQQTHIFRYIYQIPPKIYAHYTKNRLN